MACSRVAQHHSIRRLDRGPRPDHADMLLDQDLRPLCVRHVLDAVDPGKFHGRSPQLGIFHEDGGELADAGLQSLLVEREGRDGLDQFYRLRLGEILRLLADAEERFRGLGGRRADAMVLTDNTLAHQAWTAAGYTEQDDSRRWVKSL